MIDATYVCCVLRQRLPAKLCCSANALQHRLVLQQPSTLSHFVCYSECCPLCRHQTTPTEINTQGYMLRSPIRYSNIVYVSVGFVRHRLLLLLQTAIYVCCVLLQRLPAQLCCSANALQHRLVLQQPSTLSDFVCYSECCPLCRHQTTPTEINTHGYMLQSQIRYINGNSNCEP